MISGSPASAGSSWSSACTVSKNPASVGGIVLNALPVPSTNVVAGIVGRGRGERHLAVEEGGDARPRATRRVRVDLERGLDGRHRRRRVVVLDEGPAQHQDPVGARVADVEAAFGQRSVVAGRDEQELAAGTAVGSGHAEVDDPLEPHVVERAQRHRRGLDDHRAVRQVDEGEVVDGVGVGGQEPGRRVHQLREDQHGVVLDADAQEPLAHRLGRRSRERGQERVDAVHVVEVVVQRLDRLPRRRPVGELQLAEPALHPIGRRQRGQHLRSQICHL